MSTAMRNHLMAGCQVHGRQEVSCDRYCIPSVGCFPSTGICCLGVSLTARTQGAFRWRQGWFSAWKGAWLCQPAAFAPCANCPGVANALRNTTGISWSSGAILRVPLQMPGAGTQSPGHRHKFLEQKCGAQGTAASSQGSNANIGRATPELQRETVVLQGSPHLALVVLGTQLVVSDTSPCLQEWSPTTGSSPSHRGCAPASSAPGPCAATPRTWSRCCGSWLALESTSRLLLVLPWWSWPFLCSTCFFLLLQNWFSLAPEQRLVCTQQHGAGRAGPAACCSPCRLTVLRVTMRSITAFISTLVLAVQSCSPDLSLRQDLSLRGAPRGTGCTSRVRVHLEGQSFF